MVGQQYSTELHIYDNIVIQITKKKKKKKKKKKILAPFTLRADRFDFESKRKASFQSHASRHLPRRRGHFIPVRWNFSSRRHLDQYLRSRDWGPRHSTFRDHMRTRPRTPQQAHACSRAQCWRHSNHRSLAYVAHDLFCCDCLFCIRLEKQRELVSR